MSVDINLLPWREQKRQQRGRRFRLALVASVALGIGAGGALTWHYRQAHAVQQQRNAYILEQSRQLDEAVGAVDEWEAARDALLERASLLADLQAGRVQTVHVLSALSASRVDGVHYTRLSRQGDALRLTGLAESHRQVSELLRALAAAPFFSEPALSEVEVETGGGRHRFSLDMGQRRPGSAAMTGVE